MLGSKVDAGYFDSLVHRGPESIGVLEKQKIKFPAIDVIRVILVHTGLLAFFEANLSVAIGRQAFPTHIVGAFIIGGPSRSKLVRKLGLFHLFQESQVFEDTGRRRYERF